MAGEVAWSLQQPALVSRGQAALASGLHYYPNQGKLRASTGGVGGGCSITASFPFFFFCPHAFLFTLSFAIKSSLRNQFTAS